MPRRGWKYDDFAAHDDRKFSDHHRDPIKLSPWDGKYPPHIDGHQYRTEPGMLDSQHIFVRIAARMGTFAIMGLAITMAAGCGERDVNFSAFIHDHEAQVSASDYRVQPPDSIEISASAAPEIDGEVQNIRQDGKISLRLIGEVEVAGMTPVEISRKLESLLSAYYRDPKVSVRLGNAQSKKFYVFGQVTGRGAFKYTGRDTVLSAIAAAKPSPIACLDLVRIIRPSHDESKRVEMTVDVNRMLKNGHMEQNVFLQEGDIVYVPPTVLGWIGLRFGELLFPVQPAVQTVAVPSQSRNSLDYGDSTR